MSVCILWPLSTQLCLCAPCPPRTEHPQFKEMHVVNAESNVLEGFAIRRPCSIPHSLSSPAAVPRALRTLSLRRSL